MKTLRFRRRLALLGLISNLVLAGCGSDGNRSEANGLTAARETYFTFALSAGTLAESDGPTGIEVVLHTSRGALAEHATVDVIDLETGSATPGADYEVFGIQTLTFPAGSLDGTSKVVTLDPLDDLLVGCNG